MMVKSQIVLYIYDELKTNKFITISDIINKYSICERSFRRYVAEINAYLYNNFKNQVIKYDYYNKRYYLENNS